MYRSCLFSMKEQKNNVCSLRYIYSDLEVPLCDLEVPPFHLEVPLCDLEVPLSDLEVPPSDLEVPPSDLELQIWSSRSGDLEPRRHFIRRLMNSLFFRCLFVLSTYLNTLRNKTSTDLILIPLLRKVSLMECATSGYSESFLAE